MADESKYPTRIAPYGLRMPDQVKTRIQYAADQNNRSMNAEIVARLEESLAADLGVAVVRVDFMAPYEKLFETVDRLRNMANMIEERACRLYESPAAARYDDIETGPITLEQINDIVHYIQSAPTQHEGHALMREINEALPKGLGSFTSTNAPNGQQMIVFVPASSSVADWNAKPGVSPEDRSARIEKLLASAREHAVNLAAKKKAVR